MITLAPARPDDVEAIAGLMCEMEKFYGGEVTEPLEEQAAQISAVLFGEHPSAYALVAWDGDEAVGFASYSFLWPAAGFTRSLYLKELYVAEAHRHGGIGGVFMDALHATARREGCSRVEWTTDTSNEAARRFYASLGFEENASKVFYRSAL